MLRLHTIICSTRPNRVGPKVARWFHEVACESGEFECALIDLADFNLPVFDEPHHPREGKYVHEHTKRWAASVDSADAFIFVTPEYNHNPPPAFFNALDYVCAEWKYKPASFVSYGGPAGGARAVQTARLMLLVLRMVPIFEAISIPHIKNHLEGDRFVPDPAQTDAARMMLRELKRFAMQLEPLRNKS